jgi:DNA repair exonuclease SbcCD ATPase subunit
MENDEFFGWQKAIRAKIENSIKGAFEFDQLDEKIQEIFLKLQQTEEKINQLEAVKEGSQDFDVSFEEINEALKKEDDIKRELEENLKNVKKMKEMDFGVNKEFLVLYQKKIEFEIDEYSYVVELYENAYQAEGHMKYCLG